jgi:cobalt-precorrin-5B (C1)-methyltransferase
MTPPSAVEKGSETPVTGTRRTLRCGFSTGTAATAAARGALRCLLLGKSPQVIAVRLPGNLLLPIRLRDTRVLGDDAWASVIKDAGDDPDVTHRAEINARVRFFTDPGHRSGINLIAGMGVGHVTRPGLPVAIGEPAINPVPREMLLQNLEQELLQSNAIQAVPGGESAHRNQQETSAVFLPFLHGALRRKGICLEVEIGVPRGVELAAHTLNPRLGIIDGISILGTTGIVKPFSHEAYEETIQVGLKVASSNGCEQVVLSTGGKSEKFARGVLRDWPEVAFVQIADFFAFAVRQACAMGFAGIVHSVFFGKVLKMAQGHAYTHAHRTPLVLQPLADLAGELGYAGRFAEELAGANTARQALGLLKDQEAHDVIHAVARQGLARSLEIAENRLAVRLLLFDYDGTLLLDVRE